MDTLNFLAFLAVARWFTDSVFLVTGWKVRIGCPKCIQISLTLSTGSFKFGGVITQEAIQQACEKLVREHGLRDERLCELQVADAIRQAIESGDFQRHVYPQGARSIVVYIPFSGVDRLKAENRALKERIEYLEKTLNAT